MKIGENASRSPIAQSSVSKIPHRFLGAVRINGYSIGI